jgi:hypothetical protein
MPNGHDRNLVRLRLALEGFRVLHGHWPQRVRLEQGYIDDFRGLLTEQGYQQLISKVELVPAAIAGMRAEDDQGASYTYGTDNLPRIPGHVNGNEWLGRLQMKSWTDDAF